MLGLGVSKQILLIGNDGVQLYTISSKRVSLYQDFSHEGGNLSEALKKAFKEINAPLVLLFDVVEQQYRRETLPQIGFLDRSKVIKRKLQMAFPQQQMRAFLLSKQKTGSDDNNILALFGALSPNLTTIQIMDAVLSSEIAVLGSGLLPVESTLLLHKVKEAAHKKSATADTSRWAVLMTLQKTGGLRQIITKDNELALTRMTALATNPENETALAAEMQREFNATLNYLSRFGYNPAEGLDLILVSTDPVGAAFREQKNAVNSLYTLNKREAGELLGLTLVDDNDNAVYGDILHAAWTGVTRKILMPLSSPLLDRITQVRDIARMALFVLLIGIGYTGYQAVNLHLANNELQKEIFEFKSKHRSLQTQYDALSKKLNTLRYPPDRTKLALDVYDQFSKRGLFSEVLINKIIGMTDKSQMNIKKIDIRALETAPLYEMFSRLVTQGITPDDEKIKMAKGEITIEVNFVQDTTIESAALQTNNYAEQLKIIFPKAKVSVEKIVGDLSLDKAIKGISEQISATEVTGRMAKDETSSFKISGELE